MRLINKLKRLVGISISEYTIFYTNPLTPSQTMSIVNTMISKFNSNCRPNRIMASRQTATLDFQNPCMSGEQLKKVSDMTLGNNPNEISYITLDGNKIWDKNN